MNIQSIPWPRPVELRHQPVGVVIIGASVFYTPQTCGHIETEFQVRCAQSSSIETLHPSMESLRDVRLLIVDQALADDLLARPEAYGALVPDASIALAYRDVEAARGFVRRCNAARHGQIGYLPLSVPLEVSLSAMRMLLHRQLFLPFSLCPPVPARHGPGGQQAVDGAPADEIEPVDKLARLTSRERQVLGLVSTGKSNKEIARMLGITEHTVKLHNHNLCVKCGVENRTAAAHLYFAAQRSGRDVAR